MKVYHLADGNDNRSYYTTQAQANVARNRMVRDDGWVDMEVSEAVDLFLLRDSEIKMQEYLKWKLAAKLNALVAYDVNEFLECEEERWRQKNLNG